MPHDPKDIEQSLVHKFGFDLDDSRTHRFLQLKLPGRPTITTMISHSKKEYGKRLEGKVARQLHVRQPFFVEMIDCTRSREDYYEQVQKDPYPPFDLVP